MNKKRYDATIAILFAIATFFIIFYFFASKNFFEWAFARHHNVLSWYIRPLFVIPIVIGAYKKSFSTISISIFSLFTSMFWFPIPDKVNASVISFLNFEKNYLTNGWEVGKIFVIAAVIMFFVFLIYATWKRKWKLLINVIIVGAILKVIHSVVFSGNSGLSILKPAILGVVICILVVLLFLRKKK
ncbi:hypothetical protein [Gemella cuniculi]|uniref:hypothetical protein n=1 Tax=Gemella cuniculi TaxID=150240 RepID=UPI0004259BA4|nr:hypothetical protein [Gemella cuniculi]